MKGIVEAFIEQELIKRRIEYEKSRHSPNYSLHSISVGDWVNVWDIDNNKYTRPYKVLSVHLDGTIQLVLNGYNLDNPISTNIEYVDHIKITDEILIGFGFSVKKLDGYPYGDGYFYEGCDLVYQMNRNKLVYNLKKTARYSTITYLDELQSEIEPYFGIKLEWQGDNNKQV